MMSRGRSVRSDEASNNNVEVDPTEEYIKGEMKTDGRENGREKKTTCPLTLHIPRLSALLPVQDGQNRIHWRIVSTTSHSCPALLTLTVLSQR